ncbi:MAG: hypothetical protein HZB67_01230 [Candidatus Aenigmarchaeota archaeon]|nr:hypothetical protein [Candidatus Aenigmarchaeota archaeon]
MVKALFYIKSEKTPVQHEGCRMIVTTFLIHKGFTKGGAFNMPDSRVEVVLEGDKERLIAIHKEIKDNLYEWMKRASGNAEKLRKRLGNPGVVVSDLEFDEDLLVLDIGLFSHSLTFDQIYKGVSVYKDLSEAIKGLNQTLETINEKSLK